MKTIKNTVRALALLLLVLIGLVIARQHRSFDAPYPDIRASSDPAVIERGRHLAYGLAHCASCHGDPAQHAALEAGQEVALSGGHAWHLPIGVVRAKNITPDRETGVGRYSDAELARILRYGVHADGHALLPFMPFAGMADDDLTAVISFLRAQRPVRHAVPANDMNALGKVAIAFMLEPRGPSVEPPHSMPPEASIAYGSYLANSIGNCISCHTPIDTRTGKFTGPAFSGGARLVSDRNPSKTFVTPNLTPDADGRLAGWSEDMFVARMHAGPTDRDSPMPWRAFSRMSDDDARALFRYLRSLPPSHRVPQRAPTVASNP